MVKIKTTVVTSKKNSDACDAIQNTVQLMTGDPTFPTPSPTLSDIQNQVDVVRALDVESKNGDKGVIAEKRTARTILNSLFVQLCLYIVFTLRNNPNAADVIISKGLVPAQTGGHPVPSFDSPTNVKAAVSKAPGCIDLDWRVASQRGIHGFVVEIANGSDTDTAVWRVYGSSTASRFRISGLDRGKFYCLRVRSVGAGSVYSDPSEVTTCMAG